MSLTTLEPLSSLRRAKTPFADVVFVCAKCVRRLGSDGRSLRKAIKRAAKRRSGGKVRLVATRCFSLCPKRRVVLASARLLGDRRLLVASPAADASATLDELLGPQPPAEVGGVSGAGFGGG